MGKAGRNSVTQETGSVKRARSKQSHFANSHTGVNCIKLLKHVYFLFLLSIQAFVEFIAIPELSVMS